MVAVDRGSLARSLAKAVVDLCDLKVASAIKGVIDATGAFKHDKPGEPTAEEGARLLLQRAAYAAAVRVIQAQARKAPVLAAEADPREIEAALTGVATAAELELTAAAFADPESWPAFTALLDLFDRLTKAGGVDEQTRPLLRRAFADALPLALAGEWTDRERAGDYRALKAELERRTPFDDAAQRALDWRAYRDRLIRAVDAPLRTLAPELIRCSLTDLYVPLRAMVGDPDGPEARGRRGGDGAKRRILWLDEALYGWATRPNPAPTDAFRVLSGEPGAGKSSACAMLAARLAGEGRRVLLVPLARLSIVGDSRIELTRHLTAELGHDALDHARRHDGEPLVLILDGLDELAKAGQGATALLGGFVGQLSGEIGTINRDGVRIRLLLAGRPGAATATDAIVRGDARLHVLRYTIPRDDYSRFDDKSLAGLDQRKDWWRHFDPVNGMPVSLERNDPHIDSLTEQPLLNWLLAQILSLESPKKATTLGGVHDLYSRLFGHVLRRAHRRTDGDGSSEAIDAAGRDRLERMLEEVAVAAWHAGGDRAVPLPAVEKRLQEAGLGGELERVSKDRDHALTALLDSFFCRAHQGTDHRVVEFTHKSFGQFLIARRIVREVEGIHRRLEGGGDADDALGCLSRWLKLCGPTSMDHAVFDFLRQEVFAAWNAERDVAAWRLTLAPLFTTCMTEGMPLPASETRARAVERQTRNAEVSLLAILSAITAATPADLPRVTLPRASLSATLHRLLGTAPEFSVPRRSLNALDLTGVNLRSANLAGANLKDANLTGADLTRADLMGVWLTGADLTRADLIGTNLTSATLWGANLTGADLTRTDLTHANLMGANLTQAKLIGANLAGANLIHANLMGAKLMGADMMDANPMGADMMNADLTRANLKNANLTHTNLIGVNLTGANLAHANLVGADLTRANLAGANLVGAIGKFPRSQP